MDFKGLLFVSFSAFIIYFLSLISKKGEMTSFRKNLLLIGLHYGGWIVVYLGQGITKESILFSFIGVLLFGALNFAENRRRLSV